MKRDLPNIAPSGRKIYIVLHLLDEILHLSDENFETFFVLLPKILGCWGFFARAFLLGRLDIIF